MDNISIIAAIRPMNYKGHELLGERWPKCVSALRTALQQNGFEDPDTTDSLLLFAFNHPSSAITSIVGAIGKIRNEYNVKDPAQKLPLQIVLHLVEPNDHLPALRNPDAEMWEDLRPESLYITRPLRSLWSHLMAGKDTGGCVLKDHSRALTRLVFTAKKEIRHQTLLAFRTLPLGGGHKECFYCGMHNHTPPNCPSKFLDMRISGLTMAGYLPFERLNMLYKKVFSAPEKLINELAAGLPPEELRRRDDLKVLIAYLDLNRVYQPRFLYNLTFCVYSKWDSVFSPDKIKVDNKNLHLGLDCLRVGQYGRAEELFVKEAAPNAPKRFYATAGLALLALENGRSADMRTHLEMLGNIALQEKERLYATLMLSKCYELTDEEWKARDIIKNAASIKGDCVETQYRRIQLEVKGNFTETAFQQLRGMMSDDRDLYMTVLLDPKLAPIQGKVEDILSTQYHTLRHAAEENCNAAAVEVEHCRDWFGDGEEKVKENLAALETLQKALARGSYFDMLDVAAKARALSSAAKQLREEKLNELYEATDRLQVRWNGYFNFWRGYPFAFLFKSFHGRLLPIKERLARLRQLAKKGGGEEYRQAVALLKKAAQEMRRLRPQIRRMQLANLFLGSVVVFAKYLAIIEAVVIGVSVVAAIGLGLVPAHGSLAGLGRLAADPMFQRKFMFVATVIVAPFVALAISFRKIGR